MVGKGHMMLSVSFVVKLVLLILMVGVVLPQVAIFWIESIRVKKDPDRVKLHTREKE
jgi:hypothetical protein